MGVVCFPSIHSEFTPSWEFGGGGGVGVFLLFFGTVTVAVFHKAYEKGNVNKTFIDTTELVLIFLKLFFELATL